MHESRWEDEGGLVLPEERLAESIENLESAVVRSAPSEESLVIVALLMRIYDIQMALLSEVNKEEADKIYDAHEAGGHFNPQIFIPKVSTGP